MLKPQLAWLLHWPSSCRVTINNLRLCLPCGALRRDGDKPYSWIIAADVAGRFKGWRNTQYSFPLLFWKQAIFLPMKSWASDQSTRPIILNVTPLISCRSERPPCINMSEKACALCIRKACSHITVSAAQNKKKKRGRIMPCCLSRPFVILSVSQCLQYSLGNELQVTLPLNV